MWVWCWFVLLLELCVAAVAPLVEFVRPTSDFAAVFDAVTSRSDTVDAALALDVAVVAPSACRRRRRAALDLRSRLVVTHTVYGVLGMQQLGLRRLGIRCPQ